MARPPRLPEWASDDLYTAPAIAVGEPTKVTPPDAYVGQGFQPSETPPAEFFNWLENLETRWLRFVAYAQMRTFMLMATLSTINVHVGALAFSTSITPTSTDDPWVIAGVGGAGDYRHSPCGFGRATDPEAYEAAGSPPDITGATTVRIEAIFSSAGVEIFYTFTDIGTVWNSPDGDNWFDGTGFIDTEGEPVYDIASNEDMAVLVCRNVSADVDVFSNPNAANLATWTKRLVPTLAVKLESATWDGLRFIATGNTKTATSADGITWALVADPPAHIRKIRSNPDTNVTIGFTLAGDLLYRTTDGATWTTVAAPGGAGEFWWDLHFADGIWVVTRALGADPDENVSAFFSDDDGLTWNPIRLPMEVKAVAWGQGRWIFMCHSGADTLVYSSLVME